MNPSLIFQIKNNVAFITLNRPEKRNALNKTLLISLQEALNTIINDDQIKAVIITGRGTSFCSGLDIKAIKTKQFLNYIKNNIKIPELMAKCEKPIIGAINGPAITGGLEIALNCDFLIASEKASFTDSHAHVGIHPGWGITQLLQQAIGQRRAKQMSFTSEPISAEIAYKWGLINEIVSDKELINRSMEIANKICINKTEIFFTIKKLIENRNYMSHEAATIIEKQGFQNFIKFKLAKMKEPILASKEIKNKI